MLTAPLGIPEVVHGDWSLAPFLSLVALGALGTGIAYVLGTVAAGRLGAAWTSASIFITSPVALLLGIALLNERGALLSILGAITCVAGAMIIRRPGQPR